MSDLLPCPFCGAKADVEHDEYYNTYFVLCEFCDCSMGVQWGSDKAVIETEQEAIEAWNTREQSNES